MLAAGLLLTGGASRRMGQDKATLRLHAPPAGASPAGASPAGATLAERTGWLLASATEPVLEIGPGRSGLPALLEMPPGAGPLAAVAAGWEALSALGWDGPVVVVATDLPRLNGRMLAWLVSQPPGRAVVPLSGGRPQPLCARYDSAHLEVAVELVRDGARSMRTLLGAIDPWLVPPHQWEPAAGDPLCLDDVDTPEQLAALPVEQLAALPAKQPLS